MLDAQQHVTQTATWSWSPVAGRGVRSPVDGELVWSPNYFRLLGYEPDEVHPTTHLFLDHVHPQDRQIVLDTIAARRVSEFRMVRRDGVTRFFRATQIARYQATHGRPERVVGTVEDLTDARRSDALIDAHIAISEGLAQWVSLERDAEAVLCRFATAIQCFRAALWVQRDDVLVAVAYWDEDNSLGKDLILEVPVRHGEGVTGKAWQRREPVYVTDVEGERDYAYREMVEAAGIRGMLALPLLAGEKFVALAGFASHDPLDLSGSELRSLDAMSQTLGRFLAMRTAELGRPLLSQRERELLQLAADGYNGTEIAARLHISRETVKSHFKHIYTKLDVPDRASAVAAGMRLGLLT